MRAAPHAARSRSRIVAAAIRLFLADGYARTTIAAVAAAAGVSADLVFHLFGSKRELLRAAMDASVGGDDQDVPFLERAEPQAMRHGGINVVAMARCDVYGGIIAAR